MFFYKPYKYILIFIFFVALLIQSLCFTNISIIRSSKFIHRRGHNHEKKLYKHEAIYLSVHWMHPSMYSSFVRSCRSRLTISTVIPLIVQEADHQSIYTIWRHIRIAIVRFEWTNFPWTGPWAFWNGFFLPFIRTMWLLAWSIHEKSGEIEI